MTRWWSYIVGDLLIALVCGILAFVLFRFARQHLEPGARATALWFALFLMLLGISHGLGVLALFAPVGDIHAILVATLGVASIYTVAANARRIPELARQLRNTDPADAMTAVRREVEERKRVEAKLRRSESALQRKFMELRTLNSELHEFTYAAAHDLKSPSIAILGWLRGFAADHQDMLNEPEREELQAVMTLVDRMRRQTSDVLDYSRLIGTPLEEPRDLDLGEIFADARALVLGREEKSSASITIRNLPRVSGHFEALLLLATNLLDNAIKFQPGGGVPRVEVAAVTIDPERGDFVLSVADNGIGISADHADRIFAAFMRLNHASSYDGTGLGLALCRRVAVLHGGEIWVNKSHVGGADLRVRLPLASSVLFGSTAA